MVELLLYALYPVYANAGHLPQNKKKYKAYIILKYDNSPGYADILSSFLTYLWPHVPSS